MKPQTSFKLQKKCHVSKNNVVGSTQPAMDVLSAPVKYLTNVIGDQRTIRNLVHTIVFEVNPLVTPLC